MPIVAGKSRFGTQPLAGAVEDAVVMRVVVLVVAMVVVVVEAGIILVVVMLADPAQSQS